MHGINCMQLFMSSWSLGQPYSLDVMQPPTAVRCTQQNKHASYLCACCFHGLCTAAVPCMLSMMTLCSAAVLKAGALLRVCCAMETHTNQHHCTTKTVGTWNQRPAVEHKYGLTFDIAMMASQLMQLMQLMQATVARGCKLARVRHKKPGMLEANQALCSQPYILPGQPQAHSFEAFQASLHKACWHIRHQTGKAVAAWLTGGPSVITTTNGSSPSGPAQKPHSTWHDQLRTLTDARHQWITTRHS
jgi:hypothetical protein